MVELTNFDFAWGDDLSQVLKEGKHNIVIQRRASCSLGWFGPSAIYRLVETNTFLIKKKCIPSSFLNQMHFIKMCSRHIKTQLSLNMLTLLIAWLISQYFVLIFSYFDFLIDSLLICTLGLTSKRESQKYTTSRTLQTMSLTKKHLNKKMKVSAALRVRIATATLAPHSRNTTSKTCWHLRVMVVKLSSS